MLQIVKQKTDAPHHQHTYHTNCDEKLSINQMALHPDLEITQRPFSYNNSVLICAYKITHNFYQPL